MRVCVSMYEWDRAGDRPLCKLQGISCAQRHLVLGLPPCRGNNSVQTPHGRSYSASKHHPPHGTPAARLYLYVTWNMEERQKIRMNTDGAFKSVFSWQEVQFTVTSDGSSYHHCGVRNCLAPMSTEVHLICLCCTEWLNASYFISGAEFYLLSF